MPVINIAIHHVDQEQKTRLIETLTHEAVEITGVPADKFVVLIDEYDDGAIGLGGRTRAEIVGRQAS
jgi:4-oxalocrotonate tautomerase